MPHNAAQYVVVNILPKIVGARPGNYGLSYIEAATLERILNDDAQEYFYSATISTASALSSINGGYYSWATVKLYYSDYYLLRGLLALYGVCIFYEGYKPRTLRATPADAARSPSGRRNSTTHGVVIEAAKISLNHLAAFSQDIAGEHPLDWVRERREEANYWHSRLPEPRAPIHMKVCQAHGVRRVLANYLNDPTLTYPFDPDHAMLAFNLLLWRQLMEQLKRRSKFDFTTDELTYMRSLFVDQTGSIGALQQLLYPEATP